MTENKFLAGRFRGSVGYPLLCVVVLAACVLLARPFAEMGFDDDWSYIWSARVLADTGHVTYNGWGAMMLGWQMYLGAFFIKLFGFSFSTVRIPVFLLALLTAGLLQRFFVRCGLNERNACLGTLTVVLSPMFLPLAFSFMSDVPSLFCLLLCLYSCLRALEATGDGAAAGWLAFAGLSNAALGTVRQIAWLGVLVIVPCATWLLRRRRGALLTGAVVWVASVGAIYGTLQWFKRQPYTFAEPLRAKSFAPLKNDVHCVLTMLFFALPVLVAFLARFPFRSERRWTLLLIAAPLIYTLVLFAVTRAPVHWLAPFSWDEVSARGIDIPGTLAGVRPDVMRTYSRILLTVLAMVTMIASAFYLVRGRGAVAASPGKVSGHQLAWLLGPFTAAYILLIVSREFIFDRYWIPVLVVVAVGLLRLYQVRVQARVPTLSFVTLALIAVFSVMSTHDLFATFRAQLAATQMLRDAGVPRKQFWAGLEYDGWTQLQLSGYINNPRLENPRGAFHDYHWSRFRSECKPWWDTWMPDIHPRYELSYLPLFCLQTSPFGPVEYHTWLAPRTRFLYVLKVPDKPWY